MFWGRERELAELRAWNRERSRLVVIYGRRRVGKTRLVEEAFAKAPMLKVEGLEGQGQAEQQRVFLRAMSDHLGRPELRRIRSMSWLEIFEMFSTAQGKRPCVLFLDEFQWLAVGRNRLISHLKHAWDNLLSKRNRVLLILCGSVSSFMVNRVMRSKALYGRVDLELPLQPLAVDEVRDHFVPKRSLKEFVELYMALGGIPQYLRLVDLSQSARLNVERLCFAPNAYMVNEFERLFASHFGANRRYRDLLLVLARRGWATRARLQSDVGLDSGGRISEYLSNLELAGFVESYASIDKPRGMRNRRYRLADPYLLFYFRFIHHQRTRINRQRGKATLSSFLPERRYGAWRGLAFEYLCLTCHERIADRLGFGAVAYDVGSWFGRDVEGRKAQVDLLFLRADGVITLCEVKFTDRKIGTEVIGEVERKLDVYPNPRQRTIERVLISAAAPTRQLEVSGYFHRMLSLVDLFG